MNELKKSWFAKEELKQLNGGYGRKVKLRSLVAFAVSLTNLILLYFVTNLSDCPAARKLRIVCFK